MKNEQKLAVFIFAILLVAVGFSWTFNLSLNPQTFQLGYTVYSPQGDQLRGFIPYQKVATASQECPSSCPEESSGFASQCRDGGFKVYSGPCCQTLCSGRVASSGEENSL